MPSQINVGTEDHPVWEKLGDPNSIVNMPMERFRFHAGLCSWTDRKRTSVIKEGLKKLYGNKLQNNSVKAFGRDLTPREIKEIKKGENAVFPIEGDVVPRIQKVTKKRRITGAARPTKPKSNAKPEKIQSRKRTHSTEDEEGVSSEEEARTQIRPHKRGRYGGKEDSIADEVDDLVMFEESPIIIDQAGATQRYSLRPTRRGTKASTRLETIEEPSSEISADEEYEEPHRESDRVESPSLESSVEEEEEERPASRAPFRRIRRPGEIGGKSKGPSWVASIADKDQSNEGTDHRNTAVPVNIDGTNHYATYEGLISNEPPYWIGGSGTLPGGQLPETSGASSAQNQSGPSQPHPFDAMMKMPLSEQRNPEREETLLEAHRKWVRDFLGDDAALKRIRTEQPVEPIPGSATQGCANNAPAPNLSPIYILRKVNQSSMALPSPHAQPSQTRKQKLDAEWAQVFEQLFVDLGFQSVNYGEVQPCDEEEAQSLVDALLPTREVYFAWTGEPAPRTDPQQSYRKQFDTIFGAFQDWWREHRPEDDPFPILTGVMHWGRSVDDWEPPSKDSIYYEAFRQGHRAPWGANGQLADLPGWRLEDAFREE
ncbi:hypothetical protein IMSHALPRED_000077 [Imshaugia aleurites]|uniref:Uncharacterized protein n=1 Tax=Imshaugia aleurites TaxID=172621 RepID=A0A8H3EH44_9LECA|nr:hypothetical protein IMSHALPRED_000077 [Imshaugia aleurites]